MSTQNVFVHRRTEILAISPRAVERRDDLGNQYAFSEMAKIIQRLQQLLLSVEDDDLSVVPDAAWPELVTYLELFQGLSDAAIAFNPRQDNAPGRKAEIEHRANAAYAEFFNKFSPIISLSAALKGYQQSKGEIEEAQKQLQELLYEAKSNVEETQNKLLEILEAARDRSTEFVSTIEAEHFGTASDQFSLSANKWLKWTMLSAGALLIVSFVMMLFAFSERVNLLTLAVLTQVSLSKLVIIGLMAYLTNLCARNYFANKHNETVNKHRKNAILSYRALLAPVSSPENRDVILAHAASAVFAPQESAYVKGGGGAVEVPATIVNAFAKTTPG